MEGIDYVIHLAALAHQVGDTQLNDADYERVNAIPSEVIARTANQSGVKRIIFISSIAALCSESETLVDEHTSPAPTTPYGRSKLEAENRIERVLTGSRSTDSVSIRPTLVYGPGNPGNMERISKLTRLPIPLPFGGFKNQRTFLYIGNLISAIEQSLSAPNISGNRYILSDDQSVSTAELTRAIANARGKKKWIISLPSRLLSALAAIGDFTKSRLNISTGIDTYSLTKLQASLQTSNTGFKRDACWQPPYTLTEGIQNTFKES